MDTLINYSGFRKNAQHKGRGLDKAAEFLNCGSLVWTVGLTKLPFAKPNNAWFKKM